ncbi:MAG: TetR/AcrR family transcriptional regulator [Bacteroidota bacterium]
MPRFKRINDFIMSEQDVKNKILSESQQLFLRYGFKSITMDDISRELGISKKTLYQFFTDKNELVHQCVDHYLHNLNSMCNQITVVKDVDAIEVMLRIAEQVRQMIRQVNPSSLFDLKKYFKPAWDKLEADRRGFIKQLIKENLEHGIKKGLYRKDLDTEITANIYIHLTGLLTDPDNYEHHGMDIRTMQIEIIKYHLRSICTAKGQEMLEEKLSRLKLPN